MTRSRTRSIGVDPAFRVERELLCDLHLVRATSDEFFAREHPLAHFDEPVIDLAFIDGMHLAEYALRDFINTERYTHAASVIVIDDMLPRNVAEADRDRRRPRVGAGLGRRCLQARGGAPRPAPGPRVPGGRHRAHGHDRGPAARPDSTALLTAYDDLVEAVVVPDPQGVPDEILSRSRALDPESSWPLRSGTTFAACARSRTRAPGPRSPRCSRARAWPLPSAAPVPASGSRAVARAVARPASRP